jgi:glycogen synthase
VPIVASTGGLVDTVQDGVNGFHIGRAFNINCDRIYAEDVEALTSAIKRAAKVYGTAEYIRMSQECMSQDLSWKVCSGAPTTCFFFTPCPLHTKQNLKMVKQYLHSQ